MKSKTLRAIGLIAMVVTMITVTVNCGQRRPPNLSVVGDTAIKGRQVIAAANGVVTAVDALATQKIIRPDDAAKVMGIMRQAGGVAQQLASALTVMDSATTETARSGAAADARRYLTTVLLLVQSSVIPIQDANAREQVANLLKNISALILDVASVLPVRPTPPPAPTPPAAQVFGLRPAFA